MDVAVETIGKDFSLDSSDFVLWDAHFHIDRMSRGRYRKGTMSVDQLLEADINPSPLVKGHLRGGFLQKLNLWKLLN